jgi:hypothetical protein
MRRKSVFKVTRAMFAMAPDSSVPVGPAPTRTMVSRSRCFEGSSSVSAVS